MKGKNVLVTGAGGSIGSQLCEQILAEGASSLSLVSLTESGLYNIERKLRALNSDTKLLPILGSVCDRGLMDDVCAGVDIIIHAAAHKHVPICEANPLAAIENNVRGTLTIATAAEQADVSQFVLISTDKAVRPVSVMGATKRVAEMIVAAKSTSTQTIFTAVRFGNVLDSAGSVLPLWREQIANGGPITLTDPRCERYFMSIPQACQLVLGALHMRQAGTFVLDMGEPRRLVDMAQQLIVASGMRCDIQCIGLRPGEKLTEELHFGGELVATSNPKIFSIDERHQLDWRRSILDELLQASAARAKARAVALLRDMTSDLQNAA
jgi:FlaA1/EpsC-like NDP-sugar epimerase